MLSFLFYLILSRSDTVAPPLAIAFKTKSIIEFLLKNILFIYIYNSEELLHQLQGNHHIRLRHARVLEIIVSVIIIIIVFKCFYL